jgi:hypothetical protein
MSVRASDAVECPDFHIGSLQSPSPKENHADGDVMAEKRDNFDQVQCFDVAVGFQVPHNSLIGPGKPFRRDV